MTPSPVYPAAYTLPAASTARSLAPPWKRSTCGVWAVAVAGPATTAPTAMAMTAARMAATPVCRGLPSGHTETGRAGFGPGGAGRRSGDGRDRHLIELDRGAALAGARAHGVERLVAAAHRLLGLEQRDAEALPGLAVDEHEHLRALETGRRLARLDLPADEADRIVDLGGVALERRYARVHVASLLSARTGDAAYADAVPAADAQRWTTPVRSRAATHGEQLRLGARGRERRDPCPRAVADGDRPAGLDGVGPAAAGAGRGKAGRRRARRRRRHLAAPGVDDVVRAEAAVQRMQLTEPGVEREPPVGPGAPGVGQEDAQRGALLRVERMHERAGRAAAIERVDRRAGGIHRARDRHALHEQPECRLLDDDLGSQLAALDVIGSHAIVAVVADLAQVQRRAVGRHRVELVAAA